VKGGETVLVLDRKVPVARITPIDQVAAQATG
jgi:antitoxin (DNA-binding transcriptional repressor) of toxin-antitoxin stability system